LRSRRCLFLVNRPFRCKIPPSCVFRYCLAESNDLLFFFPPLHYFSHAVDASFPPEPLASGETSFFRCGNCVATRPPSWRSPDANSLLENRFLNHFSFFLEYSVGKRSPFLRFFPLALDFLSIFSDHGCLRENLPHLLAVGNMLL